MSVVLDRPNDARVVGVPAGVDDDWAGCGLEAAAVGDGAGGVTAGEAWARVGLLEEHMTDAASRRGGKRDPRVGSGPARRGEGVAGRDPGVALAIEFVRGHISEVFGVEALLRVSRMPRRSLEIAFRQSVGCTPYEFIRRARVARAMELLSAPGGRTLTQIADACGFRDLRRFRLVFLRDVGMSPSEYRASRRRRG